MELTLNVTWFLLAATAFLVVPKRSAKICLALLCAAAFLFPIISASDDLIADRTLTDPDAAAVVSIVLSVGLMTVARLRSARSALLLLHLATPSDPRSPPAR